MAGGVAVLPQAAGYGVVIGIGLFFSAFMICITWVQNRYTSYNTGSVEEFSSASKSVKPGLIASGIVSAWTWAATLLQSSAVAYKFGISGPWWYAAGATIQVMLFAQNAAKLKLHAPNAHTYLEVIADRWGTLAHITFLFFGLLTNIVVSSMLILGGSATVTDLTGMPTLAACFLIPIGVAIYVLVGGMRATLLCDYVHTAVLIVFLLTFMFTIYAGSSLIGSPSAMYELLQAAAVRAPVDGNAGGSYLTMRSKSGLIFGVINIVGNFGTVYNDQAYWQRAVASKPATAVKAFTLGGCAWFAVPFGIATSLGLGAVALTTSPTFPGYPNPLTPAEVSAGLPAPAAAAALLGQSGAALMLVLLFLAVTSATSAEQIAVSSIGAYDVYKRYINPGANDKQILRADIISIGVYAIFMGVFGTIWFYIGISMGYLYELMGTLIGSAVCPIALAIMSKKANRKACILGAWLGLAAGLVAWLVCAATLNGGKINLDTTGQDYPMLSGNLAALGVGTIISVAGTLIWPEHYEFDRSFATAMAPDTPQLDTKEKDVGVTTTQIPVDTVTGEDPVSLNRAFRFAVWFSLLLTLVLIILIPIPLFFSSHVYTKAGFTAWVAVSFIWLFFAFGAVVVYPIYESRIELRSLFSAILADIKGKRPNTGKL